MMIPEMMLYVVCASDTSNVPQVRAANKWKYDCESDLITWFCKEGQFGYLLKKVLRYHVVT